MKQQKEGNWFRRHKVLTVILGFVALIIIGSALSGGGSDSGSTGGTNQAAKKSETDYRFQDRADKQPKDVEAVVGEAAEVDGVKVTVSSAEYLTSLGQFSQAASGKTFLVINVSLENASDRTKSYNGFDFRVQTAGGQVLDQTFESVDPSLGSGDLVAGGSTAGNVVFEVPVEDGHQYVIWKPSAWGADRAIIQVK